MSDEFPDVQDAVDAIRDGVLQVWDTYGWIQGRLGDEEEGFCAMGAWYKATGLDRDLFGSDPLTTVFRKCFEAAVHELTGERCTGVEGYNDCHDTSAEDVRLVTKHAFSFMAETLPQVNFSLLQPLPQASDG